MTCIYGILASYCRASSHAVSINMEFFCSLSHATASLCFFCCFIQQNRLQTPIWLRAFGAAYAAYLLRPIMLIMDIQLEWLVAVEILLDASGYCFLGICIVTQMRLSAKSIPPYARYSAVWPLVLLVLLNAPLIKLYDYQPQLLFQMALLTSGILKLMHLTSILYLGRALVEETGNDAASEREATDQLALQFGLVSQFHHEVATPLAELSLRVQRIDENPTLSESMKEDVEAISRLTTQVQSLVGVTRRIGPPWGQESASPQPNNVNVILDTVVLELKRSLAPLPAKIERRYSRGTVVYAPETELYQIARNILKNALEAAASYLKSSEPAKIMIVTRVEGYWEEEGVVRVRVVDSGPGFDKEVLSSVVQEGFTTKSYGSGQGLHVVKQLVERNSGQLRLANEDGAGGLVEFTLPLHRGYR